MLRNDGDFVIYMIQKEAGRGWSTICYDYYGKSFPEEFSSSGKCWQETGIHGTYDFESAKIACNNLNNAYNGEFKIAKCSISQKTMLLDFDGYK